MSCFAPMLLENLLITQDGYTMLMREVETLEQDYSPIKKKMDADYNANISLWQTFWTEATLNSRLEAGDSSMMAELNTALPNNGRPQWYINYVRPLCNMVSGYQRRNRKSSIVVPLENGDQETADQWTKIVLHVFKKAGAYESISDAFSQGACISGMNLLHVYVDYRNDPISGDIKIDNLAYNQFYTDPYWRKTDLSDCSFVWRRSYMSHSSAASLMPEKYDDIMALPGNPTGMGKDGRFNWAPESYGLSQANRVAYDEYYYRDYRTQKLLIDKVTGETLEIQDNQDIDLDMFLKENPQVTVLEQEVPTIRLAIAIQDRIFFDGPSGWDHYPFVPVVGYYNPMLPYFYSRIQSICTSLRDPQILLNRRIILSADLLESQVNSGWIFKENALVDVKHLFQTGQGRIIPLKREAQMTDIAPIVPPQIPPSFFQQQDTYQNALFKVSGINEELMGMAIDDKAGILAALRQGAGLTTLQPLFDRLDRAQSILTERIMEAVRNNYTPGKIQKILEGQQPAPLFYNKAFGKYHCAVEAGFNTETQKQMEFAQLIQLKEMGVAIEDSWLLEAATLQNKNKYIKLAQQKSEQAAQMQQAQMQAAMQEQQAKVELAHARAQADKGLAVERVSRVEENHALAIERMAQANKDDEIALLNKIKLIKELEGIDLGHLESLIRLSNELRMSESQQAYMQKEPQPLQNGSELGR